MKHTQRNSCVQSSIDTSTDPSSKFILDDSGNSEPPIRHGDHCDVRDRSTEPGTGRTRRINSETQPKTDQGNKVTKLSLQPTAGHKDDPASFARPRQPSEWRPLRVRTARNTAWITATTLHQLRSFVCGASPFQPWWWWEVRVDVTVYQMLLAVPEGPRTLGTRIASALLPDGGG